tara:strand:+ start:1966 stop:2211 length:246 start_codon:yes stop_codon:yes gene_type:complete
VCRAFIRYHLNGGQRCLKVETGKAYALKWRSRIVFIPKEYVKMYDFEDGFTRWIVEIPTWLEEKNEDLRFILELIADENRN